MLRQQRKPSPVPLLPNQFWFFGNVPSMKNGKQISCKDSRGKPLSRPNVRLNDKCKDFLVHMSSQQLEQYTKWINLIGGQDKIQGLKKIVLMYQFIRPNKRSVFDYTNATEILQDALTGKVYETQRKGNTDLKYVKHLQNMPNLRKFLKWIPEDNSNRVVAAYHPDILYDANSPGVVITYFASFKEYVDFLVYRKIGC